MNNRTTLRKRTNPGVLFNFLIGALLILAGCGTFEVGIERTPTTNDTVTPTAAIPATSTARRTPFMATPTPTPVPVQLLGVAFVKEGDVWLWTAERKEAVPLTHTGDVGDGNVKISDDGAIVAFTRRRGLWTVNADGTGERTLVSEADFDAMEPTDPGVSLSRFAWVPGTHILAFNTHLRQEFGDNPTDDLHLVSADTLEHTALLPPGEGGHFYYSPDGSQIAIVTSGIISLVDADGENRRDSVLTYTPSRAYAEDRYYAQPVWAADGSALGVAIPPVDPYAQPTQHTSIWHIPTDGTPGRLIANIATAPLGQIIFSPDLARVAYLQQPESAAPGSDQFDLMIMDLGSHEKVAYSSVVWRASDWSPDSQHFAFVPVPHSESQLPRAQIGRVGSDPLPVDAGLDTVVLDLRWIDASRYLLLAKNIAQDIWKVLLGGIGAPSIVLASIPELPGNDVPPYDFATVHPGAQAVSTPFPAPQLTSTSIPGPSTLHVAFVKDGDVWLWTGESAEIISLTSAGGVSDVKISDDGKMVAFVREDELWVVSSDGADERQLVSASDFDAMEPTDPGVQLNRFDWIPGTHLLAFNTRLRMEIGLVLNEDLRLVDADTLEQTVLLPPGEGGEFHYSPDGRQVAVVRAGIISLVDADGSRRREALTYTPVATASEFYFYARPVWAADSRSLRVAVPPVDPHAQPPQPTSIWHIPTDGTPARLLGSIMTAPHSQPAFSPDFNYVAYLKQPEGTPAGSSQGSLLVTDLSNDEAVTYFPEIHNLYGWSPDSQHFAFLTNPQLPQAQIGRLGDDAVPAYGDAESAVIDVRWIDASRYLFLAQSSQGWDILLGEIGGPTTIVAAVAGPRSAFDFAR
jgi:dipeptidyl aminopeptidase/acylaminoacyl peptidase